MLSRVLRAWKNILLGRPSVVALELTNKCPLSCPGCYAFQPGHVSGASLVDMPEHRGDALVTQVLALLDRLRPLGIFLVGGEPLLRVRELNQLLPEICRRGIEVEVVTSGVTRLPAEWKDLGIRISVSIDGLQPDHDQRRKPATYERILRNIEGHEVIVHCTITKQMLAREDALEGFTDFWSQRPEVCSIRISLYTPQIGEVSAEILSAEERTRVLAELERLRRSYPKLRVNPEMLRAYANPPASPADCVFAQITRCLSPDLTTPVLPCQLGGEPDCSQCGCAAAVGLQAIAHHQLPGGLRLSSIFKASVRLGRLVGRLTH